MQGKNLKVGREKGENCTKNGIECRGNELNA